jgi:hypothetical protein
MSESDQAFGKWQSLRTDDFFVIGGVDLSTAGSTLKVIAGFGDYW